MEIYKDRKRGLWVENILFVCTGNTCRSPMAAALFKHLNNSDQLNVQSAGVFAADGSDASTFAKEALEEKGIACEHSSALLNEEHIEWASIILTMTNSHKQSVIDSFPHAGRKTYTLPEYVGYNGGDILDPFGGSLEMYRLTRDDLEDLVKQLLEKIKSK
ncbi:low molecular weight protein arginine phosphatase [Metabacillus fastidiosus]